MRAALVRGQR